MSSKERTREVVARRIHDQTVDYLWRNRPVHLTGLSRAEFEQIMTDSKNYETLIKEVQNGKD